MHTTVVLGVGLVLARLREAGQLHRGVRLIFQPAEETSPGGAVDAISCGVLDGVSEVYALHCDPRTDVGQIALRVGPITSAVDQVTVTVTGTGGHTSRPHLTADLVGALGALATETPAAAVATGRSAQRAVDDVGPDPRGIGGQRHPAGRA